jgi:hypothetical protein
MKKLLIHLGYPKAASTTLQNGLFYNLHKSNIINFLGRAWESGYFGLADNKKDYKSWFRSVLENNASIASSNGEGKIIIEFSGDKLNVLSEGLFITNEKHDEELVIPEKIAGYFRDKVDKTELLFVIRNQQTLIMSDFVQNYKKMGSQTFAEYLNIKISSKKKKKFKIFYFYNLISRYAELMGKENIHVIFFEDLVNDKRRFCHQLGEILDVQDDIIHAVIDKAYLNKTPQEKKGHLVRKTGRLSLSQRIRHAVSKKEIVVPEIKEEEKALIFNSFRVNNLMLAEEFNLDKERMKNYGYI